MSWRYASARGNESTNDVTSESAVQKPAWRSLYTEERHKEKDSSLLEPKVDQWRMKDRVRSCAFTRPLLWLSPLLGPFCAG